jgi:hypothetical protein
MYQHFKQKGNLLVSKPVKYGSLIAGIILLVFVPVSLVYLKDNTPYWLFFAGSGILNIGLFGKRVVFDTNQKKFTLSYFGLLKKEYAFKQFKQFYILRHMAYGIFHNGTDIKMIIQEANQEKEITLYMRIGGKKRIADIVDEIKMILSTDKEMHGKIKLEI